MQVFVSILLGVLSAGAALSDHAPSPDSQPITREGNIPGNHLHRVRETRDAQEGHEIEGDDDMPPETVLSVQYDKGMIKELYVSQLRTGRRHEGGYLPVLAKQRLCEDICEAGLGGAPCGSSCLDAMPALLSEMASPGAVRDHAPWPASQRRMMRGGPNKGNSSSTPVEAQPSGAPRAEVCPTLCDAMLGEPLCNCPKKSSQLHPDWLSVCGAFCEGSAPPYRAPGCPPCAPQSAEDARSQGTPPSDAWVQWCQYQCSKGDGGAACNCDKAPFSAQ